jgi:molybdopterin adenylyltransferase
VRPAAVVTVSDGCYEGRREDVSGRWLVERLRERFTVVSHRVVPDDAAAIVGAVRDAIAAGARLVVTTGGTGLGPRDVTPEALQPLFERTVPGMAEAMRGAALGETPMAMLSRQVVGVVGATLVVVLPGALAAVQSGLSVVWPVLPHALDLLEGRTRHEAEPGGDPASSPK